MTNSKTTKRALVASILVLCMCFTMLIGTTFAWFTDSATSSGNVIKTGTLDVEMYWAKGTEDPASANWNDASKGAIFNNDKWEPGYAEVRHIKIANEGSLSLKYKVQIIANGEVSKLADVIDVYYADPAVQVTSAAELTESNKLGTLTTVLANLETTGSGNLAAGKADTITLAFKMQDDAGNEYQGLSIGTDFSIQIVATQTTVESDSFGDQYDNDAEYPAVSTVTVPENNTEDVVLSTETVKVTVPASATEKNDVYKIEVRNENIVTDSATGETTVGFDLTMYKNDAKVSGDTVYAVELNVGKSLFISEVTHNGTALKKDITGAGGEDQTWTYDAVTGVLTIYTKSFSPFAITYNTYKDYVRKLNRAHTTSSYISTTTGADLLPLVAIMPEITGYSVFDGDTRITDAVYFRFSDVKKETIDENSYKVSLNLAIKDDKGNDLELKPGMPSTINGKEYLHVYMNLIEVPEGYSISEVKVNGSTFTLTNNASGNTATGEYWIGSNAKDLYFQSMEAGLIEVILTKAN